MSVEGKYFDFTKLREWKQSNNVHTGIPTYIQHKMFIYLIFYLFITNGDSPGITLSTDIPGWGSKLITNKKQNID